MNGTPSTRTPGFAAKIIGVLAAGLAIAFLAPVMIFEDSYWNQTERVGLNEIMSVLNLSSWSWIVTLFWAGAVGAVVSAVVFTSEQRNLQKKCISLSGIALVVLPVVIVTRLIDFNSGGSVGPGFVALALVGPITVILAWCG